MYVIWIIPCQEDGHHGKNVGSVANSPVSPVEDGTISCARMRAEECHDRVGDSKEHSEEPNNRVSATKGDWIESTLFYDHQEETQEGEEHCQAHQQSEQINLS